MPNMSPVAKTPVLLTISTSLNIVVSFWNLFGCTRRNASRTAATNEHTFFLWQKRIVSYTITAQMVASTTETRQSACTELLNKCWKSPLQHKGMGSFFRARAGLFPHACGIICTCLVFLLHLIRCILYVDVIPLVSCFMLSKICLDKQRMILHIFSYVI